MWSRLVSTAIFFIPILLHDVHDAYIPHIRHKCNEGTYVSMTEIALAVAGWLLACSAIAGIAVLAGRDFRTWFLLSALASPIVGIIGLLALLFRPRDETK